MIQGDERSAIGNVDDATADIVKDIAGAMPPKGIETMKAAGNAAEGALSKDRVRRRAYEMWDADGRPSGDGKDYWLKAEEEVRSRNPKPKGG